jgi:mono/diheme cytochrome c family protein
LAAIGVLKTVVTIDVYVEAALAMTIRPDATQYDRRVSTGRLALTAAALFVVFSGAAFTLAKLHLARPPVATGGKLVLGDAAAGRAAFARTCAACHGTGGRGGSIGPKLAGASISLAAARAKIDTGGSVMPAKLVGGKDERDVLAYLATILASK